MLSTSTRSNDLRFNRSLYAAQGVPIYVVVDPVDRDVQFMRLDSDQYQADANEGRWRLQICGDREIEMSASEILR